MEDKDQDCPVCKSEKYLNPDLTLLVSPCFHKMCTQCVNRLFTTGPAPCPICKTILKKINFVSQTFEDLLVEKEVLIRRRVGKYFNLTIANFNGSLKEYNNYLEEVETIMYNLIHDIDVEKTKEKVEKFKLENKALIAANTSKQISEEKAIAFRIEREKKERQLRKEAYMNKAIEEAKQKQAEREEIINKLTTSNVSLVKQTLLKAKHKPVAFQHVEDVEIDMSELNAHEMEIDDEVLNQSEFHAMDSEYTEELLHVLPTYNDPLTLKYKNEEGPSSRAGGYLPILTYKRSLFEAFNGLLHNI